MSAQREITVKPAFHHCNTDRRKDYGIGTARMIWTLRLGPDAISWDVSTGWGMPEEEFHAACPDCVHPRHRGPWPDAPASGGAVDWHCSWPVLGDTAHRIEHCKVLDGPCYPDVGYLIADDVFNLLCLEGSEAVWTRLEELLTEYVAVAR